MRNRNPSQANRAPRGLRIGILTYGMGKELTGIGTYTRDLTYAVREASPETEIILLNPHPESTLDWYNDFPVLALPMLATPAPMVALGAMVLAWVSRRLGLDILHDACNIAPFLAPRLGVRRVVTVYDTIPLLAPQAYPLMHRVAYRTFIPAARWTADAVMTVSEESARDISRLTGIPRHKVHVTYPGIRLPSEQELAGWRNKVPEVLSQFGITEPYFLYPGALNPRKNMVRVTQAFESLLQRDSEVQLVLVGPNSWPSEKVERAAARIGRRLLRLGYVDAETLHILYTGARAVVYVSLYEGFGFPVLEAMAHGTAVITSNRSSLPEVAGDAGLLVDPTEPGEIEGAMDRLLSDRFLASSLSERGRNRAAEFSWARSAQEALRVYRAVAGCPSPPNPEHIGSD